MSVLKSRTRQHLVTSKRSRVNLKGKNPTARKAIADQFRRWRANPKGYPLSAAEVHRRSGMRK